MLNEIKPPIGDEHRYNGLCQLVAQEALANPANNVCNRCMYSIGTERKACANTAEFDVKALERDGYKHRDVLGVTPAEINVPLTWYEIDQIVLALRFTNKAFSREKRDNLEEKMNEYSCMSKKV